MHVAKANVNGNPNVGLFGFDAGEAVLFGEKLRTKQKHLFEEVLGKPLRTIRIAGTNFPGVFLAGNSKATLVPRIIFDSEERVLKDLGLKYVIMDTEVTCLGNTIACNDHGAIVGTEFSESEVKFIEKHLGVEVVKMDVAGLTTPGAVIVVNGKRAVVHKDVSDEELKIIEKTLKVKAFPASINLGGPYLRAGLLRTTHGFIVGDLSGGPEIVNIDEALGYHALE